MEEFVFDRNNTDSNDLIGPYAKIKYSYGFCIQYNEVICFFVKTVQTNNYFIRP